MPLVFAISIADSVLSRQPLARNSLGNNEIAQGADEIDIVNSDLEETMVMAYREIHQIWKSDARIQRLRTTAFISAINKIALAYHELGIFP